ncbi:MAG: ABC transporter ATP-binding protein [Acidimicrobiaceae bacterium]|nr:ABC transporter ATP-binding protein [Acidimicrobiaceae bacterium]MYE98576.1 ABC transporter ATP-binding protein [Acidimicrobiaceae bacterium]MYH43488.1 ABC transporter ATP-binding protein [Acidimicrobiaceae bacterium]MYI54727.1 ABC transporter ATP-binding protein [Acidimicrobiaceae bacterium]MYJ80978.1 ABC transporter ATP-binding protein [Acidimicrobiaceae bacterium]
MSELSCTGLRKAFGGLVVTNDLALGVSSGEVHALIGPNGAGKTTALAQLSGELRPDGGTVWLDGADITHLSLPLRVRAGVARSYQISSIFQGFTVAENVELALQATDRHSFRFFRPAASNTARVARASELLDRVGLTAAAGISARRLAHGQTRQLEIAMAMASRPKVLLLDEPMAGMAPDEARRLADLVRSLASDTAVLLVEHDMDIVFSAADRVSVLCEGALIASGDPDKIRADPEVRRLYLRDDSEAED